jgi:hypothetical protein
MTTTDPETIVRAALAKDELDKLLLGAPEYQYRSRYSPAPGNTDLTELLSVIYDCFDAKAMETAKERLLKALYSFCDTYEGMDAVSTCILFETVRKSGGRPILGLPLEDLATRLQATIQAFEPRLRADKSGGGRHWPDGMLGDLRRLSLNTERYGGPPFCK